MDTGAVRRSGIRSYRGVGIGLLIAVVLIALWEWQDWPIVWRHVTTVLVVVAWSGLPAALGAVRRRRLPD